MSIPVKSAQVNGVGVLARVMEEGGPRRCNVLVVDDEKIIHTTLSCLLRSPVRAIDTADDGDTGLEKIQQAPGKYQLLIVDHAMRRMDGLELVKQLKQMGFPGKIIVLSGYLSRQHEEAYRSLGVDKIIYKPADPVELRRAVQDLTG